MVNLISGLFFSKSYQTSSESTLSLFHDIFFFYKKSSSIEEATVVIRELNLTKSPHDFSISMLSQQSHSSSVKRLSGQFGFNPSTMHTRKLSQLVGSQSSTESNINLRHFKASMSQHREKNKGAKRLSAGKFSFGNEKKQARGHAIEQSINLQKKKSQILLIDFTSRLVYSSQPGQEALSLRTEQRISQGQRPPRTERARCQFNG